MWQTALWGGDRLLGRRGLFRRLSGKYRNSRSRFFSSRTLADVGQPRFLGNLLGCGSVEVAVTVVVGRLVEGIVAGSVRVDSGIRGIQNVLGM